MDNKYLAIKIINIFCERKNKDIDVPNEMI